MPLFDHKKASDITTIKAVSGTQFLTGHENGKIRLWEVRLQSDGSYTFKVEKTFSDHEGPILHLVSDPSNPRNFISISEDNTLKVWMGWRSITLQSDASCSISFAGCEAVAFLPKQGLVAVGGMVSPAWGGFDIWDINTGQCLFTEQGRVHRPHGMALACVNGYLAWHPHCADYSLSIWNVSQYGCQKVSECIDQRIYSMAVSPKGEIITGGFSLNIFQLSPKGVLWKYDKSDIPNSNVIDVIMPISNDAVAIVDRQGHCSGTVKMVDISKHWGNLENRDATFQSVTTLGGQYESVYLPHRGIMVWSDCTGRGLSYEKLSLQPSAGYSKTEQIIHVGQAEIRKNARLLAQACRTTGNIWTTLPIELTMKIAIMTGWLEPTVMPAAYNADQFFLTHFNHRPPISYYPLGTRV